MLIVRQTYKDKTTDKRANINIELLEPSDQSELISRQQFNQYLNASMGFVKGTVETFNRWVTIFMKDHMNALPLGDQSTFKLQAVIQKFNIIMVITRLQRMNVW